ncbi:hypothetical protein [Erwinia billingiae]|uniref:hypothetical protein n=1 Tax=Erwinia billingiae TaxID=182337 RepID=UPI00320A4F5C
MDRKIATLYEGEDFKAEGEFTGGFLFLHCTVHQHSFKTLRKIKNTLQDIKDMAHSQWGYTESLFAYTQNGRWCRLIGGEYLSSVEVDNQTYEVWEWQ